MTRPQFRDTISANYHLKNGFMLHSRSLKTSDKSLSVSEDSSVIRVSCFFSCDTISFLTSLTFDNGSSILWPKLLCFKPRDTATSSTLVSSKIDIFSATPSRILTKTSNCEPLWNGEHLIDFDFWRFLGFVFLKINGYSYLSLCKGSNLFLMTYF